jgi:hypothetical protein
VETRVVRVLIVSFASFLLCPTFISTAAGADCVVACMERSGCWSGGSVHEPQRCNNMPELCNIQCRNQNRDSWGAIAYSVKDKGFGYSDGWPDLTRAKNTALDNCSRHGMGCQLWMWDNRECGALAADGEKVGWGTSSVKQTADQRAVAECAKSGGKKCAIQVSQCSR